MPLQIVKSLPHGDIYAGADPVLSMTSLLFVPHPPEKHERWYRVEEEPKVGQAMVVAFRDQLNRGAFSFLTAKYLGSGNLVTLTGNTIALYFGECAYWYPIENPPMEK